MWFSAGEHWEPTANKAKLEGDKLRKLSAAETCLEGNGLVRIGVMPETAPHDWRALQQLSGMSSKIANSLYKEG